MKHTSSTFEEVVRYIEQNNTSILRIEPLRVFSKDYTVIMRNGAQKEVNEDTASKLLNDGENLYLFEAKHILPIEEPFDVVQARRERITAYLFQKENRFSELQHN